jgi:hypothetical protein
MANLGFFGSEVRPSQHRALAEAHALEELVLDVVLVQHDAGRGPQVKTVETGRLQLHDVEGPGG